MEDRLIWKKRLKRDLNPRLDSTRFGGFESHFRRFWCSSHFVAYHHKKSIGDLLKHLLKKLDLNWVC
jgi:hypothetical protein